MTVDLAELTPDQVAAIGAYRNKESGQLKEALDIVERYTYYTALVGIIPVPWIDALGITGLQLKMLNDLTRFYGQQFSKNLGKSFIASLLGGTGSTAAAYGAVGSWVKGIPGVGPLLGIATMPVLGGAATYAIGNVFINYFEQGGRFEFFDSTSDEIKKQMKQMLATGETLLEKVKARDQAVSDMQKSIDNLTKKVDALDKKVK